MRRQSITANERERVDIEEEVQKLHQQAQLRSKDKENMTALGSILVERRKAVSKYAAHLICSNTPLDTLASKNKVRIAAHIKRSITALSTLASEKKVRNNVCLTAHS